MKKNVLYTKLYQMMLVVWVVIKFIYGVLTIFLAAIGFLLILPAHCRDKKFLSRMTSSIYNYKND